MSSLRRQIGMSLVVLSLLLYLFTVVCYVTLPDAFAAYTVMPIWLWGGAGLLLLAIAFYFFKARFSILLSGVWILTLLMGSDEAKALLHLGMEVPQCGPATPYHGKPVLRVMTFNTANFYFGNPTEEIAAWEPDIILLQQTNPALTIQIAERVFQGKGEFRTVLFNGVISRWKIRKESADPKTRSQQIEIETPDGRLLTVVNVHLATAATDLQLWTKSAWRDHGKNRKLRKKEISQILQTLQQSSSPAETSIIFGGDFNSPSTDVIHRRLSKEFVDAFSKVGTGWGNTFHSRFPILRIDHIYTSQHLTPVRCRAIKTLKSDHRYVVADFLIQSMPHHANHP